MAQRGSTPYGTIPAIAQAFQNDPRTRLANSQLMAGSSTAPVAQGGWAVTDGLARAAQAVVGALVQKKLGKEQLGREQAFTTDLAGSIAPPPAGLQVSQPLDSSMPPAPAPSLQNAALALGGGAAPPQMGGMSPQMAPPAPQTGPMGGSMGGMPQTPPMGVPPIQGMTGQRADPLAAGAVPYEAFKAAIIGQETGGRYGVKNTEGSGATGIGQVMPETGAALAKRIGQPWRPDLMSGTSPQAKQYQDAITDAAVREAYNAGGGGKDIATSAKYYFGGSDKGKWGRKTQRYAQDILGRLGSADAGSGGAPQSFSYADAVAPPQMEDVPAAPQAPTTRPDMPAVPEQVRSQRIGIAQRMLQSGNPDMVAIAQQYLDKGLDEDFSAAQTTNAQQYGRENMGYQSELSDTNAALGDARQAGYQNNRDAQSRNFQRETGYRDQTFQAGQNAEQRNFQASMQDDNQAFQAGENDKQRAFEREKTQLELQARTQAAQSGGGKSWMNTAAGQSLITKQQESDANIDKAIAAYQEMGSLAPSIDSGGAYGLPGVGALSRGVKRSFDSKFARFSQLSDSATFADLGGLGAQISDGDRDFITGTQPGVNQPRQTNIDGINARLGSLKRKKEYEFFAMNTRMSNPAQYPEFQRQWKAFSESAPLMQKDPKTGKVTTTPDPIGFEQWLTSRPKFDARGNRIK